LAHRLLCAHAVRSLPIVVLVSVASSPAFAQWDALGGALASGLSQLSCQSSTALTEYSSRSHTTGRECENTSDCHARYACNSGRCVPREREATQVDASRCEVDDDCPARLGCKLSHCIEAEPQAPVAAQRCETPADCGAGKTCASGRCAAEPPLPPTSLRRQGSELYVRERVVELREELALGQGPVINGLANVEGVSAKKLGRALREHRAELVALIGDGSGDAWASKFVTRVEQLCGPT
jgi:hypothetical protein